MWPEPGSLGSWLGSRVPHRLGRCPENSNQDAPRHFASVQTFPFRRVRISRTPKRPLSPYLNRPWTGERNRTSSMSYGVMERVSSNWPSGSFNSSTSANALSSAGGA